MHLFVPDGFKYFHRVFNFNTFRYRFYYGICDASFHRMSLKGSFKVRLVDTKVNYAMESFQIHPKLFSLKIFSLLGSKMQRDSDLDEQVLGPDKGFIRGNGLVSKYHYVDPVGIETYRDRWIRYNDYLELVEY